VSIRLLTGDCREMMSGEGPFDLIMADPPYEDTSLAWDRKVHGWLRVAAQRLKPTGSIWMFGSMRSLIGSSGEIARAKLRYAQDIVWEKPNGTGFAADRFKRVHEHAVQLYRVGAPWIEVYNEVQRVPYDGPDKHVRARRSHRGNHVRQIAHADYEDDGTRIVRSVIPAPNVRDGIHKTQKPVSLLELLIRTSCPPGGLVGDFFAGSGAAGEACAMSGRNYVGCEIDPDMAAKAKTRLGSNLFASAA
jgi:site-specific DNA-methyltransferase (adenine-specific)